MLFFLAACISAPQTEPKEEIDIGQSAELEKWTGNALIYIVASTTSDWTTISFDAMTDPDECYITYRGQDIDCHLDPGEGKVFINQDLDLVKAGRKVVVEAILSIVPGRSGSIGFQIGRGHIGETTVEFFLLEPGRTTYLGGAKWDGISEIDPEANALSYSVYVDEPGELELPPESELEAVRAFVAGWVEFILAGKEDVSRLYWPEAVHESVSPSSNFKRLEGIDAIAQDAVNKPIDKAELAKLSYAEEAYLIPVDDDTVITVLDGWYVDFPFVDRHMLEKRNGVWKILTAQMKLGRP